jgi:hypothetical protein
MVDAGYWRPSLLDIDIYPCDPLLSKCLGGVSNDTCGTGYVGPLC